MAEQDPYHGISTVSPEAPPETPPLPPPVEEEPPWSKKLAQLERLTQQLQMDNAALRATVETTQRLRPPEPEPEPAPQGPPPRPQASEYTDQQRYDQDMEAWLDQRTEYRAQQALQAAEQQRQRQAQEAELVRTQEELDAKLHAREAALRETLPDYNQRAQQVASQMSQATYWAVRATGEAAPDLVVHLAAHPEVLQRLNQTQPHLLGFEVGRLAAQIAPAPATEAAPAETPPAGTPVPAAPAPPAPQSSAPPATRPPPPAPPQTVTGGGVVPPSGFHDQMSQSAYEAERRRQNPRLFRR